MVSRGAFRNEQLANLTVLMFDQPADSESPAIFFPLVGFCELTRCAERDGFDAIGDTVVDVSDAGIADALQP